MAGTTTPTQSRQMTTRPPADIGALEETAKRYSPAALATMGHCERAIVLARGVREVRKALEPFAEDIMALMNNRLGFLTDRDPRRNPKADKPYPAETVLDCAAEALLRGLYLCNNEWNIIRGNCYTTKNGWKRLVEEIEGLSNLNISLGVPTMRENGAVVRVRASWRLRGQRMELTDEKGEPGRLIAVRLDGMGVDAALGKVEARVYAAIHKMATGSTWEPDEEPQPLLDAKEPAPTGTRTEQLADKLASQRGNGNGAKATARPEAAPRPAPKASPETLAKIQGLIARLGLTSDEVAEYLDRTYMHASPDELLQGQAEEYLRNLTEQAAREEAGASQ